MSQYMVDEARLREIVRLVITIVLEEMERSGNSSLRCATCSSAETSQDAPAKRPEGVSCSRIIAPKSTGAAATAIPVEPAPVDWRSKKLLTEHEIKNIGRNSRIIISKRTIVTPLAADTARDRGIVLKKE